VVALIGMGIYALVAYGIIITNAAGINDTELCGGNVTLQQCRDIMRISGILGLLVILCCCPACIGINYYYIRMIRRGKRFFVFLELGTLR
jgi:hypothetical protein